MSHHCRAAALAAAAILAAQPAFAHAIAGVRVFPVTLTLDDPGVADEATIPEIQFQPEPGSTTTQIQWEFDKTITPATALIYNQGYNFMQQKGAKNYSAIQNAVLTGKWQAWVSPEHEFLMSLGVQEEFNATAATANAGGDMYGATSPTFYFGKGLGDLPIGNLRPLAVTGELSYAIPNRLLNAALDNSGNPRAINAGLSIQYSIPYLESQVKDHGLGEFFGRLIPLAEMTYFTPASAPAGGFPMRLQFSAGAVYLADTYQVGLEMLIPGNRAAGSSLGVVAQFHVFLDDIFPDSLGKPLFQ